MISDYIIIGLSFIFAEILSRISIESKSPSIYLR